MSRACRTTSPCTRSSLRKLLAPVCDVSWRRLGIASRRGSLRYQSSSDCRCQRRSLRPCSAWRCRRVSWTTPQRAWLWLPFAVVLRWGFHALLRSGEFLGAARGHVTLPSQALLGFGQRVDVAILDPKNRRAGGRFQFASTDDAITIAWSDWLLRDLPRGWKVFPAGAPTFASLYREALASLAVSASSPLPSERAAPQRCSWRVRLLTGCGFVVVGPVKNTRTLHSGGHGVSSNGAAIG